MKLIATVFSLGFVPYVPGTAGSLVGLLLAGMLSGNPTCQIAGVLTVSALGFWSAGPAARAMGAKDPRAVIIDEVAGMMLALAALPATWRVYLAGFLLFRFLDIVKPLGLRRVERLPGSWGIMLDDLLAGLLVQVLLRSLPAVFN